MIAITTFTITIVTELDEKIDGVTAHIKEPSIMGNTAFVGENVGQEFGQKLHDRIKYAVLSKIADKIPKPEGYEETDTSANNSIEVKN